MWVKTKSALLKTKTESTTIITILSPISSESSTTKFILIVSYLVFDTNSKYGFLKDE